MKTYKLEITETLQRIIEVEASTEKEALDKIRKLYKEEKIILDSSNYVDTEFTILED